MQDREFARKVKDGWAEADRRVRHLESTVDSDDLRFVYWRGVRDTLGRVLDLRDGKVKDVLEPDEGGEGMWPWRG